MQKLDLLQSGLFSKAFPQSPMQATTSPLKNSKPNYTIHVDETRTVASGNHGVNTWLRFRNCGGT
jgi:hypothetical protein